MQFFDTHCHIDLDEFEHDRSEVLSSALKQGVTRMLVPGITLARTHHLLSLKPPAGIALIKQWAYTLFLAEHQAGDLSS